MKDSGIAIAGEVQGEPALVASCYKLEASRMYVLSIYYGQHSLMGIMAEHQLRGLQRWLAEVLSDER